MWITQHRYLHVSFSVCYRAFILLQKSESGSRQNYACYVCRYHPLGVKLVLRSNTRVCVCVCVALCFPKLPCSPLKPHTHTHSYSPSLSPPSLPLSLSLTSPFLAAFARLALPASYDRHMDLSCRAKPQHCATKNRTMMPCSCHPQ